jgi:hypothetical protein
MYYSGSLIPLAYASRWDNASEGAKKYIKYLKNNHINKEEV